MRKVVENAARNVGLYAAYHDGKYKFSRQPLCYHAVGRSSQFGEIYEGAKQALTFLSGVAEGLSLARKLRDELCDKYFQESMR